VLRFGTGKRNANRPGKSPGPGGYKNIQRFPVHEIRLIWKSFLKTFFEMKIIA